MAAGAGAGAAGLPQDATYECSVHGTVHESEHAALDRLLGSLCFSSLPFFHYENVMVHRGGGGAAGAEMRVQFYYKPSGAERPLFPLRLVGQPTLKKDGGAAIPVAIRTVWEAPVTAPLEFLRALGYSDGFEFFRQGQLHTHPLGVTVAVAKVEKLRNRNDTSSAVAVHGDTYLVEVCAVTADKTQDRAVEAVRTVARQLAPRVALSGVSMRDMKKFAGK